MRELLHTLLKINEKDPNADVGTLAKAVAGSAASIMLGPYFGLAKVATVDMMKKIKDLARSAQEVKVEGDKVSYHNVVVPSSIIHYTFEVLGNKAKLIWTSGEVGLMDGYNTIFVGTKEKPYIAFRRKSDKVGNDLDEVLIYPKVGEPTPLSFRNADDLVKTLGAYKGRI